MDVITDQDTLEATCAELRRARYVTVDTEFMRERTYWPKLCLVQLARPAGEWGDEIAVIVDPMAEIDLQPLFDLMRDPDVLKVFHAARQDVEIFVNLMGEVPAPIFDTQVAAMVCGYGDQVGYETLVKKIAKAQLDKSSRFTDWARRPLSERQLTYALGDVTHLRTIYERFEAKLAKDGRASWVASEMDVLRSIDTYVTDPEEAWRRLKTRSSDPVFLGVVKALARWRESEAQARDVPRGRLLKDDALLEIAAAKPETRDQLMSTRSLQKEGRKAETADAILEAVRIGKDAPVREERKKDRRQPLKPGAVALMDLLKVLLKAQAERLGVAQRLIASTADLEALVSEPEPDIAVLKGWRRDAFGDIAGRLLRGEIALVAGPSGVEWIETPD